ncbi:glucuronate isomerase [Wenyingzhuangia heitensis]|uniref:Uronate isomerase n=1 Tax=Wenyingzhuangia heitensis TaxID=1487859 RepID=A0ABX0UBN6_9FLAO|nr:glucuronate isomerase [Wenyingzhuangia heitensis]NIJ46245.1 glucuronate isomerase [Wenyingzhuangia heitensis]
MGGIKKDNNFMTEDFLLQTETAKKLYHNHAEKMPIIDYHNHLLPEKIAKNECFKDITEVWLSGDHYKWRAMRANGIDEKYITGNTTTSYEKFEKWAETVPYTVRNPLFHWTHMELKKYFGITDILQPSTCKEIYDKASKKLQNTTPEQLLLEANVEVVCTTDDPIDDLKWHQQIAEGDFKIKVLPTFRPDAVFSIKATGFVEYIQKLADRSEIAITDLKSLMAALQQRVDFFASLGCRLSDFGVAGPLIFDTFSDEIANDAFVKVLHGKSISEEEIVHYSSYVLYQLATMYHAKDWAQQYHLGSVRNNNDRLMRNLGADVGCDSVSDDVYAHQMSKLFNKLDSDEKLAKTITYNLNPAENEVFATMMGNYSGNTPGKMQWGSAWWFLDQKDGMEKQLQTLSNIGLLSRFVGMLTDSRSFMSFPRHEYFRRILCNEIGRDVENGEIPNDLSFLGKMVEDICYYNALNYFKF